MHFLFFCTFFYPRVSWESPRHRDSCIFYDNMLAVFLWIKYSKVMKSDLLIVLICSYVPHKQCTPGAGPSSSMKSGMVQMTHLCRSEAGGLLTQPWRGVLISQMMFRQHLHTPVFPSLSLPSRCQWKQLQCLWAPR